MLKYFKQIIMELWSILVGMRITLKYLLSKPVTVQYPEQRTVMFERFRGRIEANPDKCISCLFCVNNCPVSCIALSGEKAEIPAKVVTKEGKEMKRIKNVTQFDVNISSCIQCGICTEGCPTDAIYFTKDYENSALSREELLKHYVK
jgi:NADH-quinone oxidoreductase subunit I